MAYSSPWLFTPKAFWVPGEGREVVELLDELVEEMERRYAVLAQARCDDLQTSRAATGQPMPRPGPGTRGGSQAAGARPALLLLGAAGAEAVARGAYRAMHAGRPMVLHGLKDRLLAVAGPLPPRFLWRVIVGVLNRSAPAWAAKA